jgi:tetratricopeptide (TPR) repeat protein
MLLEQRQLHEALEHCRAAVRLRPNFAEAHSNLGNVLREMGRLAEAKACYAEALRLQPKQAMIHNNLGQALQEEGKLDEALACYQRGLQFEPNLARLHCNLASLLEEQEKYAEAITRYEIALRLEPNYAEAHNGLGWVGHELGRYEEAQDRYRTALRLKPDFAPAHCNLGTVREELNDFAEAEHCWRQALRYDPQHAGAWSQLATLLRDKLPEGDLTAMRQLLADPDLTDGKRATLCFGLGQVLDARKSYDEAAEHLRQANAMALREWCKRGQGYDPANHTVFIDRLMATFTPAFFQRMRGPGADSERPIFIVGLPRSGTTLTEQVLASHSLVFGAGELRLAREEFDRLVGDEKNQNGVFNGFVALDAPGVHSLAGRYLDRLGEIEAAAPRIADKMPDNYQLLGFLATLFPQAKFIHCRRDLRDVALSCWITNFRHIRWASDPEHIAARFRDYQRVMEHWRQVLPVPLLEVDYEETVADLEGVARRLVSWCRLAWEPACLAFYKGKQPIRTASVTQVRQPIYTRSVARWKNYEKTMESLFTKLQ